MVDDMLYTISYDIPDDKRRLKIAKILLDYGPRVQYSVFEAELDEKALDRLRQRILAQVDQTEDSVRIYPHCAFCVTKIEIIGQGTVSQDPEFIII
jgi:CRISPR-associated protein Cas2